MFLHYSLLHFNSTPSPPSTSKVLVTSETKSAQSTTSLVVRSQPQKVVLLSTVLLYVISANGHYHTLRVLLDNGSQASFMTEQAALALMLKQRHSPVNITTFGSTS